MFKEMRRKDRQAEVSEAEKILARGVYGIFSTIAANGYPVGIPFNYAAEGEFIYLHSALQGHTLENVKNNSKVSFTVVNRCDVIAEEFVCNYESVVVNGTAQIACDEDKNNGLKLIIKKYSSNFIKEGNDHIKEDFENCAVFKIHIDNITGKVRN